MDSLFESICQQFGVLPVRPTDLTSEEQREVELCLRKFSAVQQAHASTRNPDHNIIMGFTNKNVFNAMAATCGEHDFVAIDIGVLRALRKKFYSINFSNVEWLKGNYDHDALATWLYECGKFFIFFHEMGHIWNGHTSWGRQHGLAFLDESRRFDGISIGNIDIQTLEMDADGFAAANVIASALSANPPPITSNNLVGSFDENQARYLFVSYAIYTFFCELYSNVDFDEERETHPSAALRQFMIAATLEASADRYSLDSKSCFDAIVAGVQKAAEAFYLNGGSIDHIKYVNSVFGGLGRGYANKLLDNWRTIYPELDVLKRGGILPLPQG